MNKTGLLIGWGLKLGDGYVAVCCMHVSIWHMFENFIIKASDLEQTLKKQKPEINGL